MGCDPVEIFLPLSSTVALPPGAAHSFGKIAFPPGQPSLQQAPFAPSFEEDYGGVMVMFLCLCSTPLIHLTFLVQVSFAGNYVPVLPDPTEARQHIAALYHSTQEIRGGRTYAYTELGLTALWLIQRHCLAQVDPLVQFMVAHLAPLTDLIVQSVKSIVPSSIVPATTPPSQCLMCSKCNHEGFAFLFTSLPATVRSRKYFCWLCYSRTDGPSVAQPTSVYTVFPWHLFQ